MKRTQQFGLMSLAVLASLCGLIFVGSSFSKSPWHLPQATLQAQENETRVARESVNAASHLFSRLKALMGEVKTASGVYMPAIFALNYYEGHWKLTTLKKIDRVDIDNSNTLLIREFRLSSVKTNFDEDGILAESIDVEVAPGPMPKAIRGRIPLRPPAPYDIKLQVRREESWSDDLSRLKTGKNEFRVVASGIAFDGKVSVNGMLVREIGGFDALGKIRHRADNYLAKNEEIGQFSYTFPDADGRVSDEESCAATPLDGNYSIQVEVNGPDRSSESRQTLLSKVHVALNAKAESLSKRAFVFKRTSCGCFAAKTMIRLGDGLTEKPIDQLKAEDRVWNPILKKSFAIRRMTKGPEALPMIRIRVEGKILDVTGKHPMFGVDGWKPAFALQAAELLRVDQDKWSRIEAIESLKSEDQPVVWNLELDAPDGEHEAHSVLANGISTGDLVLQRWLQGQK